jgi:hypothetical protein
MANYYEPTKNMTDAFYTDGTHKWYGKAAKGASLTDAAWMIFKMEYTGENWVIKYPVDPSTGLGSDAPKFSWGVDGADAALYDYNILGT